MTVTSVLIGILALRYASSQTSNYIFPENFVFGVATSSYQTEGAWNEDGKGENIWDHYLHKDPELVKDGSNGDIACDSYHKWLEDIQLIHTLGANFYRFSISWSRILPMGSANTEVNEKGVEFYNNVINALLDKGIEPYVTMYHWDLPQPLQEKGGWLNETIVDDYIYYAKLLFTLYGDRVKKWITFNEFAHFCGNGYSSGTDAPFWKNPGIGGYQCAHNALVAHGKTYRAYEKDFKATQKGQVGVTIDSEWCEPLQPNSESDMEAVEQYMQFNFGWFTHPIFLGNYPSVMIRRIDMLSAQQGFEKSRLPEFTSEQIDIILGSFDFLGLNHYFTEVCTFNNSFPQPSFESDSGVLATLSDEWKEYAPWGLKRLLVWIKNNYNNPPVIITENGLGTTDGGLNDTARVTYMRGYMSEVLKAIYEEECNVIGYTPWSLMDNLEWTRGYTTKFGLIQVDFNDPNRTRTPRQSYECVQQVFQSRRII